MVNGELGFGDSVLGLMALQLHGLGVRMESCIESCKPMAAVEAG